MDDLQNNVSLPDIETLAESFELEVKKAGGAHGLGELPKDFWITYSAMANTEGGVILLGVEEKPRGKFHLYPLEKPEKVLKSLWDGVNNRQVVSINLLSNTDVQVLPVTGRGSLIKIRVPRALRSQRPVYCGPNPITGTYRRNYEGDYRCTEDSVRRMLAEQIEESRDDKVLEGFSADDLEQETIKSYRNQFQSTKPDHPWNALDRDEFLRNLGCWRKDRQSGKTGITLAGLLMFGRLRSILDAVPLYVVDYQERDLPVTEARWIDRLTTDGTWSGNLYDFYRQVITRLYRDLKVPFHRERERRIDDSPVHEALREALTNTLIHADYTGRVGVLVVKRPDLFGFRNPGSLRIPLREAVHGGMSDCRNRNLQKMFQLVGLGEQAGSGLPKIYTNWKAEHWRPPELQERLEPEQTLLTLRMVSLLPEETIKELDRRFGQRFRGLPETARLALATSDIEGFLTNDRMQEITSLHPSDITKLLTGLARDGFLEMEGTGRGTQYSLPGMKSPKAGIEALSAKSETSSVHSGSGSVHSGSGSVHSDTPPPLTASDFDRLQHLARQFIAKKRASPSVMKEAIITLCTEHWLSVQELSQLLGRSYDTIRTHYLNPMVAENLLKIRYPERRSHPQQRYRTVIKETGNI